MTQQPEHMRAQPPAWWRSGLPLPEHAPTREEWEAEQAAHDERDRGLDMLGCGRRRRQPEPLPGDEA